MTTVGYGDYFPVTVVGRMVVGIPAMLVGMGMLGFVLSQVAGFFIRADTLNRKGLAVQKVSDHILLCNAPPMSRLLQILGELRGQPELAGATIVLVDEAMDELSDELANQGLLFVRGHPAREETLKRAQVQSANRAIVLARNATDVASDGLTVATCLSLRHLKPELHIVAECVDPANREILARAGCHSIVCVMDLAPGILAQEAHDPGVVDVLHELTIWHEDLNNVYIVPVTVAGGGESTVETLRGWAHKNDATMLGLRDTNGIKLNPAAMTPVREGDAVVLICRSRPERVQL